MATIDLEQAVRNYCWENGISFKAMNFGHLKLKLDNPANIWTRSDNNNSSERSDPRIVELTNRSYEQGSGHLNIEQSGKPVITFTLREGIVKGLPYRVKFPGPSAALKEFWAPVNAPETVIREYNGLMVDMNVPLDSQTSARAQVVNETNRCEGEFRCTATLSGTPFVVQEDDSVMEIPLQYLRVSNKVSLVGNISVHFQDTHSITVQ